MSNPDDIFEGSFMEFAVGESYVSPRERAWERWVAKVEKLLGHDLDGNQDRDGYSLDYAYDAFADGLSVAEYAAEVQSGRGAQVATS